MSSMKSSLKVAAATLPAKLLAFLNLHKRWAVEVSYTSRNALDLYWDEGVPRLVLEGHPCRGTLLATIPGRKA